MRSCQLGATANRGVVGGMNEFARLAEFHQEADPCLDLVGLAVRLAETPLWAAVRRKRQLGSRTGRHSVRDRDLTVTRMRRLRLDVRVAVRLDVETLLASVGPDLSELGRDYLARGRVRKLEEEAGGASAVIADPDRGVLGVWVGVVDGVLTGECDCVDGVPGHLCGHAVAVALAALEKKFAFSSISSRARGVDPAERRFAEVAAGLAPRALIGLVSRYAVTNPHFAASLLACAGRLPPPGPIEIGAARRVVAAAADVPNGRRWDLPDIVKAGRTMVAELELLAVRPPTDELLVVAEEAIAVWTRLSGYLYDAWERYETEPEEIGSALAGIHLRLCEAHAPAPLELAARLAKLVAEADAETFLDVPEGYADVLGERGTAEFEALLGRRSR